MQKNFIVDHDQSLMEKLLIFDLDDTIFETKSIGAAPVEPILTGFEAILSFFYDEKTISSIVRDSWKYPFDLLADKYSFDSIIVTQFASLINETDFVLDIKTFEDFALIPQRAEKKILVTTGFEKLQHAKIAALGISSLFEEISIDDQAATNRIFKKGIFEQIRRKYQLKNEEILIIGDNPKSELKAGYELEIPTVQVAKFDQPRSPYSTHFITHYEELLSILEA